eukprot:gene30343-35343_t
MSMNVDQFDQVELVGSFTYNKGNPLPADAVLVDEASMMDVQLMAVLLRALPPKCQLVLVGDPNQLPPIPPGKVLQAIMKVTVESSAEGGTRTSKLVSATQQPDKGDAASSSTTKYGGSGGNEPSSGSGLQAVPPSLYHSIPSVHLSKVFRQAENSAIIKTARQIMKGEYPEALKPTSLESFCDALKPGTLSATNHGPPGTSFRSPFGNSPGTQRTFPASSTSWSNSASSQDQLKSSHHGSHHGSQQGSHHASHQKAGGHLSSLSAAVAAFGSDAVLVKMDDDCTPTDIQEALVRIVKRLRDSGMDVHRNVQPVMNPRSLQMGGGSKGGYDRQIFAIGDRVVQAIFARGNRVAQAIFARGNRVAQAIFARGKQVAQAIFARGNRVAQAIFARGNRVAQDTSDYDRNVFNGNSGIVHSTHGFGTKPVITVDFSACPGDYLYQHSAQATLPGLGYDHQLLNRRLLYTAATRPSNLLIIIATQKALRSSLKLSDDSKVSDSLSERLATQLGGGEGLALKRLTLQDPPALLRQLGSSPIAPWETDPIPAEDPPALQSQLQSSPIAPWETGGRRPYSTRDPIPGQDPPALQRQLQSSPIAPIPFQDRTPQHSNASFGHLPWRRGSLGDEGLNPPATGPPSTPTPASVISHRAVGDWRQKDPIPAQDPPALLRQLRSFVAPWESGGRRPYSTITQGDDSDSELSDSIDEIQAVTETKARTETNSRRATPNSAPRKADAPSQPDGRSGPGENLTSEQSRWIQIASHEDMIKGMRAGLSYVSRLKGIRLKGAVSFWEAGGVTRSKEIEDPLQLLASLGQCGKDASSLSSFTKAQWSQLMGPANLGSGPGQVSPSEFFEAVVTIVESVKLVESMSAVASKAGADESGLGALISRSGSVYVTPIRRSILAQTTKWPSLSHQIKGQEERAGGCTLTYAQIRLLMAAHTAEKTAK